MSCWVNVVIKDWKAVRAKLMEFLRCHGNGRAERKEGVHERLKMHPDFLLI